MLVSVAQFLFQMKLPATLLVPCLEGQLYDLALFTLEDNEDERVHDLFIHLEKKIGGEKATSHI